MVRPKNYKKVTIETEGLNLPDLMQLNEKALEISPDDKWLTGLNFWQQRKLYLKLKELQTQGKLLTIKV